MYCLILSAGVVVAARDRVDGVNVAIKKITNSIQDESSAKQVLIPVYIQAGRKILSALGSFSGSWYEK